MNPRKEKATEGHTVAAGLLHGTDIPKANLSSDLTMILAQQFAKQMVERRTKPILVADKEKHVNIIPLSLRMFSDDEREVPCPSKRHP